MTTVNDVISDILRREGGYANRVADRGGMTNWGITAHTWASYKRLGRPATIEEVKAITEPQARAFYWDVFVGPVAEMAEPLRSLFVDWAVNSGFYEPTKALQGILYVKGLYLAGIDGVLGRKTFEAVAQDPSADKTYHELLVARVDFYFSLAIQRDPQVAVFLDAHPTAALHNLHGWCRRALEFA